MEKEAGESAPGPHYIVAAYPRPGAVWTHLALQWIRERQAGGKPKTVDSSSLIAFIDDLMHKA
jgi:hypothetical protein